MRPRTMTPTFIGISALMIALTTVFTLLVRVPVPATGGYINLSDVAITFAGLTFGPLVGFLAGGIGAGLADILGGYAQFAPLTLIAHGVEGLLIGYVGHRKGLAQMALAWLLGSAFMVAAYLVGEAVFMGMGWAAAAQEVPGNLMQVLAGGVVGIPLVLAIQRAYPPVTQLASPTEWQE